jgi:hypothetical protein
MHTPDLALTAESVSALGPLTPNSCGTMPLVGHPG